MIQKLVQKNIYGQNIIALLDKQGTLKQVYVQRHKMLNFGEIIRGNIVSFHPVLKGYFIKTSKNLSVFVPSLHKYPEGQAVTIQITKEARLGKDATGKIVSDDTPVGLPSLEKELTTQYQLPIQTDWKAIDLDEEIQEALSPSISFAKGARIYIERTQMCWTIDIDSRSSDISLYELNKCAVSVIYDQVLLKNLSGIILIDFAGRKRFQEQKKLKEQVTTLFKNDTRSQIYGFTSLGLFEIKRDRTTAALADLFLTPQGFQNPVFLSYRIKEELQKTKLGRPILFIHPSLLPYLDNDITNYTQVKTLTHIQPDFFEIKGE